MLKKILFVLYAMLVVVLAFVKDYNSWYMIALWAAVAVAGACYLVRRGRSLAVYLLHASFLVILLGALVTHFTQVKGIIHLRQGEPMAFFIDETDRIFKLEYEMRLDTFYVTYKDDSKVPEDYTSLVTILPSGEKGCISMNNILHIGQSRYYQSDYDEDGHGSILIINRDPYGIPITYTGYVLMALSFMMLVLRKNYRRYLLPVLLLTGVIAVLFMQKEYNIPVLNTWLLPVHVSLIITAYVLLLLAVWKRQLLTIALAFLACGIFLGAYWANISWGTYWSWDPKEVWALITLMVYAVPVHTASIPRFRSDKFYRTYMLVAFLCVLMTYFGVNYLLGGMHSYGA